MRYYYDDPLKAAYMMREFGFDYEGSEGSLEIYAEFYPSGEIAYLKYRFEPHGHVDIKSNFYELLKPRVGDIIIDNDGQPRKLIKVLDSKLYWYAGLDDQDYDCCYATDATIIQRDNKIWFAPKIEKND